MVTIKRSLLYDIIDAIKHWFYIYDYKFVIAVPGLDYKYFLYTKPFNRLAERVEGVDGANSISELKLKCAIAGIDFDKQIDFWELHQNRFDPLRNEFGYKWRLYGEDF